MNIILAILGIGFLIFVHELGHFLAAKFVGVRVDTFAVGFQPTIFGWRARLLAFTYGETEYVIGLVPLGGYVKMAGEEPGDPRTDSDDEFHKKPIPSRLLILVAGATMNLIFGFLLFILAYSVGVKQQTAIVGNAVAMGPAWNAGVRSGDLITAVNGDFWSDYSNVATAIALAGGSQPVALTIEREQSVVEIDVDPLWDAVAGRYRIGIQPAISDRIALVKEGSLADEVGIQIGDRLTRVRVSIPSQDLIAVSAKGITADRMLQSLSVLRRSTARGNLSLEILREEEMLVATIELSPPDDGSSREIGVIPRMRTVQAVQPGSQASESFQVGEEIVSIEAEGQTSQMIEVLDLITIGRFAGDRDVELILINRLGEKRRVGSEDLRRMLGESLIIGSGVRTVVKVGKGTQTLEIPIGAELIRVGNRNIGADDYIDEEIPAGTSVEWCNPRQPHPIQSVITEEDLTLDVILGNPARIGRTVPGSPAHASAMTAGSIIREVNGIKIERWEDLSAAIIGSEGTIAISFIDPSGSTDEVELAPVTLGQPLGIAMAADQFTEQLAVGDAVIQGGRQSWIWGGRIFLTLRALFTGDVHGKNLNGPVGIIDLGRKVSEVGFGNLFFLLALISINLGIFNLLPFPILDGGHIFFLTIEGIRGRPVPEKIQ
ncbi:MAG: RIP metalloprotease RseP, partial [Planctomycetota bacterium]